MEQEGQMGFVPHNDPRTVYIPKRLWRAIKSHCAEHDCSVSSWVRVMIEHVIESPIVEHDGKPVVVVPLVSHTAKIAAAPKKDSF